jgi:hypothetical protein
MKQSLGKALFYSVLSLLKVLDVTGSPGQVTRLQHAAHHQII